MRSLHIHKLPSFPAPSSRPQGPAHLSPLGVLHACSGRSQTCLPPQPYLHPLLLLARPGKAAPYLPTLIPSYPRVPHTHPSFSEPPLVFPDCWSYRVRIQLGLGQKCKAHPIVVLSCVTQAPKGHSQRLTTSQRNSSQISAAALSPVHRPCLPFLSRGTATPNTSILVLQS